MQKNQISYFPILSYFWYVTFECLPCTKMQKVFVLQFVLGSHTVWLDYYAHVWCSCGKLCNVFDEAFLFDVSILLSLRSGGGDTSTRGLNEMRWTINGGTLRNTYMHWCNQWRKSHRGGKSTWPDLDSNFSHTVQALTTELPSHTVDLWQIYKFLNPWSQ